MGDERTRNHMDAGKREGKRERKRKRKHTEPGKRGKKGRANGDGGTAAPAPATALVTTPIGPGADFIYWPDAICATDADIDALYARLNAKDKRTFAMMGRQCTMHRRQAMFGAPYTFSRQTVEPETTADPIVNQCLAFANQHYGPGYNAALCNLYADGNDYISPHSDDEKQHKGGAILTFSFGAARSMRFTSKAGTAKDKTQTRVDARLEHGSCGVMAGPEFQTNYKHAIPKDKSTEYRISVTVRRFF